MGKIIEAGDLPEGDKVYLKKDWLGWRTVDPLKKPDGKVNVFNLLTGGKRNLFMLAIIMFLMGMLYFGIDNLISTYKEVAENPCLYCTDCHEQTRTVLDRIGQNNINRINFSSLNISNGG